MKPAQHAAALCVVGMIFTGAASAAGDCPALLDHEFKKLHSTETINLCDQYGGKAMLIVNTASHCGFTPQFEGLEALHNKYEEAGLAIVGFSSNSFNQEAGTEEKAAEVCYINYGVTFTMMAPVQVTGEDAHPLFKELARQTTQPKWNFNKYVVDAEGNVVRHFNSGTQPDSSVLIEAIENIL